MKKVLILVILFLFVKPGTSWAQDEMFKALFMYNFTKDIEWPSSYTQGDFVIGVMGNSPIVDELDKIAEKKKVGNQTIVVKQFSSASQITKCHMVYLPPNKSSMLSSVVAKVSGKPTVVISDGPGLAQKGAAINYVKIDGKQKFEINTSTLTKNGLKVTQFLTSLGIKVG